MSALAGPLRQRRFDSCWISRGYQTSTKLCLSKPKYLALPSILILRYSLNVGPHETSTDEFWYARRISLPAFANSLFQWFQKTCVPEVNVSADESAADTQSAAQQVVLSQLNAKDDLGQNILSLEHRLDCRVLRECFSLLSMKGYCLGVSIWLVGYLHLLYWGQSVSYMLGLMLCSPLLLPTLTIQDLCTPNETLSALVKSLEDMWVSTRDFFLRTNAFTRANWSR